MHPGPDQHLVPFVQEDGHVVRVDPVHGEREDARAVARVGRPENVDPRLVRERVRHPCVDRSLLLFHELEPDPLQEV